MLQAAAAANDEANGAHYAEELATLEQDLKDNEAQRDSLEQLYQQNTEIIAQSLREIQKFQREFEAVKAKVAIGRSLENLAGMMKSSITELQGMMGGELSQSMQQLRQSAASGEGQMRATLDLEDRAAEERGVGRAGDASGWRVDEHAAGRADRERHLHQLRDHVLIHEPDVVAHAGDGRDALGLDDRRRLVAGEQHLGDVVGVGLGGVKLLLHLLRVDGDLGGFGRRNDFVLPPPDAETDDAQE